MRHHLFPHRDHGRSGGYEVLNSRCQLVRAGITTWRLVIRGLGVSGITLSNPDRMKYLVYK